MDLLISSATAIVPKCGHHRKPGIFPLISSANLISPKCYFTFNQSLWEIQNQNCYLLVKSPLHSTVLIGYHVLLAPFNIIFPSLDFFKSNFDHQILLQLALQWYERKLGFRGCPQLSSNEFIQQHSKNCWVRIGKDGLSVTHNYFNTPINYAINQGTLIVTLY